MVWTDWVLALPITLLTLFALGILLMDFLLPTLRADFALCETYAYSAGPPLDCPVSALGGLGDDRVSRDGLDAWRQQTTGPFRLGLLPGNHFFLQTAQQPLLQAVAQELEVWT